MKAQPKTTRRHIVRVPGIRGGRPVLKGTSIEVALVAKLYKLGESVDDILASYPHLSPAAVYDALSYYHDYQEEIEAYLISLELDTLLDSHGLGIDSQGHIAPKGV